MKVRQILKDEVRVTLEEPDTEYPGNISCTLAKAFPGRRFATKVLYNQGLGGERIMVPVERGSPQEVPANEARAQH